ncbi:outer membrane beta-barrel protein [Limibacter armeniacum]|uniref:outer membrane beta-barrel protein n=1 Tax=Limibacter armeniacum TaxID=466084 RepID=UPI002FE61051
MKRILWIGILCSTLMILSNQTFAQRYLKSKRLSDEANISAKILDDSHWMIGFKVGMNATMVQQDGFHSVLSSVGQNNEEEKAYTTVTNNISPNLAAQFFYYPVRFMAISVQPTFANYRYGYETSHKWLPAESGLETVRTNYKHQHSLNYFEAPMLLHFSLSKYPFRFFVQGGMYYSKLLNANKTITGDKSITEGGLTTVTEEKKKFGIDNQYYDSFWGYTAGGGIGFDLYTTRLSLEVNYKQPMMGITAPDGKYDNLELVSSYYDISDDLSMRNIEVSISMAVPLDHIGQVYNRNSYKGKKKRK